MASIRPTDVALIRPTDVALIRPTDVALIRPTDVALIRPTDVALIRSPDRVLAVGSPPRRSPTGTSVTPVTLTPLVPGVRYRFRSHAVPA
jgi:hypothetical protein